MYELDEICSNYWRTAYEKQLVLARTFYCHYNRNESKIEIRNVLWFEQCKAKAEKRRCFKANKFAIQSKQRLSRFVLKTDFPHPISSHPKWQRESERAPTLNVKAQLKLSTLPLALSYFLFIRNRSVSHLHRTLLALCPNRSHWKFKW